MGPAAEPSSSNLGRALFRARLTGVAAPLAGVLALTLMFLSGALWNGFPLTFYDTGGYLIQGLEGAFLPERSQVYSLLLLVAGGKLSLWLVAVLQSAVTAWLVLELARVEVPDLTLAGLLGIGAGLILLTGIVWYTGQVEPDIATPLLVLGCHLQMFRADVMSEGRRVAVFFITALAVASHPSHLGIMAGLLICGGLWRVLLFCFPLRLFRAGALTDTSPANASRAGEAGLSSLPKPAMPFVAGSFSLALALIVAANYGYTREVFINRSGASFLFGRLMQDGLVKKVLDDTCPGSGYRLCAYRHRLNGTIDGWLWSPDSSFRSLGGFSNRKLDGEYRRIIAESLRRYPGLHLQAAVRDSVWQFLRFRTGDGIEPQMGIVDVALRQVIPGQVPAYLAARQQRGELKFRDFNLVHVPAGVLSLLGLFLLLNRAMRRRHWQDMPLPALVLLALMGNAIICGTLGGLHNRYQSRLMWLPVLVVLVTRLRDPDAFHPVETTG